MRKDIERIDNSGQRREVWSFDLYIGHSDHIFLDYYAHQSKTPRQRIWRSNLRWSRIDKRENSLKENPPLPIDVVQEVRQYFADQLLKLEIKL